MARPKSKGLTQRELEVMQVFWEKGELTANEVRERMADEGRLLAYTTVATLIKILTNKRFLKQTNRQRPFTYQATRSFEEVSGTILSDLVTRLFGGSREQLLVRLMGQKKLTRRERQLLEEILEEKK